MSLAAKLFSIAVILVLAGGSAPSCRPLLDWIAPADAARALVRAGRGRACPALREQEPPGWLKGLATIALVLSLAVFALAAALL